MQIYVIEWSNLWTDSEPLSSNRHTTVNMPMPDNWVIDSYSIVITVDQTRSVSYYEINLKLGLRFSRRHFIFISVAQALEYLYSQYICIQI